MEDETEEHLFGDLPKTDDYISLHGNEKDPNYQLLREQIEKHIIGKVVTNVILQRSGSDYGIETTEGLLNAKQIQLSIEVGTHAYIFRLEGIIMNSGEALAEIEKDGLH